MTMKSRRVAWVGSLIGALALLGVGALPGMPATTGGQVDIIEWVNPPAVNATKAVDAAFQQALHIKVNLTTAVNRTTNYAALGRTSVQSGSQDIMAVKPIQPVPPGMPTSDLSPEQLWGVDGVYLALDTEP
jgi:ABC-type glycerol-3-phosphate transport system substrate-binding protein